MTEARPPADPARWPRRLPCDSTGSPRAPRTALSGSSARLAARQAQQAVLQRRGLRNLDGRAEDAHLPPLLGFECDLAPQPLHEIAGMVVSAPMNFAMS